MAKKKSVEPRVVTPGEADPRHNWERPIQAPGRMQVDFEERVDFRGLHAYRLARVRQALAPSGLGALLCFDQHNIRYTTGTVIGEWARDKLTRWSLLAGSGHPYVWDFGSAAKHHRLHAPWLEATHCLAGMVGLRGAVSPKAELFRSAAAEIKAILVAEGVARMPLGIDLVEPPFLFELQRLGLEIRDGQQVMLDARQIKSADEIAIMREAGLVVHEVLEELAKISEPGITLDELDAVAKRETEKRGAACAFIGLYGFPKHICISVNEQVVHGIPGKRRLVEGDLVKLDHGAVVRGWYGDAARTVSVGKVTPEAQKLADATRESLEAAIRAMVPGNRISDIGAAVQGVIEPHGYGIVRDYVGHGIGKRPHEDPQVPNYGPALWTRGQFNPRLRAGMVLAVEPMINAGTHEVRTLSDGWTVVTKDGKNSAHFEHTIAVTEKGPVVLTGPA